MQARRATAPRSALPCPLSGQLSDRQVRELRSMLEEQREFRLDQLRELHEPPRAGQLGSTEPEIVRSLVSGAREALRDIRAALSRMDDGRYGYCVACGGPVETGRLEILPQTARCMACQRA
jgi:RNA polymerase-binding transcription factor DksA